MMDGTMSRLPQLEKFGEEHGIKIISVVDLIHFRLKTEKIHQAPHQHSLPIRVW